LRRLVLVNKHEQIVKDFLYEKSFEGYSGFDVGHAYCKCGGFVGEVDFTQRFHAKRCMECVYHIRRVAVSIALAVFTCAFAWLGGNLLYG